MKKQIIILVLIIFSINSFSQISGNQVYSNNNSRGITARKAIISTDSTLIVRAKVLLNKEADYYTISIGVSQESKTVIDCLTKINSRIKNVENKFKRIGVEKMEIDFISQTKTYDHKIEGKTITEYFVGFEIKKNIIVTVNDVRKLEQIIMICSKEDMFDIIKVDYSNQEIEAINTSLFKNAIALIKKKKERFVKNSTIKLTNKHRILSEEFNVFYPKNLYKKYDEAFETSLVNVNYSSSYTKKSQRKNTTFYYNGVEFDTGIDKIIDEISPKVGIQYVIEIEMLYELEK